MLDAENATQTAAPAGCSPDGVSHTLELAASPHQGTGIEGLEVKSIVVQQSLSLRIASKEDLEATIEYEPIYNVGAHATTNLQPSCLISGLSGLVRPNGLKFARPYSSSWARVRCEAHPIASLNE